MIILVSGGIKNVVTVGNKVIARCCLDINGGIFGVIISFVLDVGNEVRECRNMIFVLSRRLIKIVGPEHIVIPVYMFLRIGICRHNLCNIILVYNGIV